MNSVEERYVLPFYLRMLGINAIQRGAELVPSIADASRLATPDEVVGLLRSHWRASHGRLAVRPPI